MTVECLNLTDNERVTTDELIYSPPRSLQEIILHRTSHATPDYLTEICDRMLHTQTMTPNSKTLHAESNIPAEPDSDGQLAHHES